MSFQSLNKHSWTQYRYSHANDNKPLKLWIRGLDKIYETETGFAAANENGDIDKQFLTFEEAETCLDNSKASIV